jgi:putative sterol carrier protein
MAVFDSDQQLYTVLQSVFERLSAEPENADKLAKSNIVIRMNFTDPAAQVTLDGRHDATEVFYGPTPGNANMEFSMSADLLHNIWMGEESTSQAFFSGQIKTKGNFMKAMKLVDLFRECERVYPAVAAEHRLQ